MHAIHHPSLGEIGSNNLNTLEGYILTLIFVGEEVGHRNGLCLHSVVARNLGNLLQCEAANLDSLVVDTHGCTAEVNLHLVAKGKLVVCGEVELKTCGGVLNIQTLLRGEVVEPHVGDYNTLDGGVGDGCTLAQSENVSDGGDTRRLGLRLGGAAAIATLAKSLVGEFHTEEDGTGCVVGSCGAVESSVGRELDNGALGEAGEFHRVVVVCGGGEVVVGRILCCTLVSLDGLCDSLATVHAEVDGLVATCAPSYGVEVEVFVARNAHGFRGELTLLFALAKFEAGSSLTTNLGLAEAVGSIGTVVASLNEGAVRSILALAGYGRLGLGGAALTVGVRDVESILNLVFATLLIVEVFTLNGDNIACVQTFGCPIDGGTCAVNKAIHIDAAALVHEVEVAILSVDATADGTGKLVGGCRVCLLDKLCNGDSLCAGVGLGSATTGGATAYTTTCREVNLCATATGGNLNIVQTVNRSHACRETERKGLGHLLEVELCGCEVPATCKLCPLCEGVAHSAPFCAVATDEEGELVVLEGAVAILGVFLGAEGDGHCVTLELGERNAADGYIVLGLAEEEVVAAATIVVGVVGVAGGVCTNGDVLRSVSHSALALGSGVAILLAHVGPEVAILLGNLLVEVVEVDNLAEGHLTLAGLCYIDGNGGFVHRDFDGLVACTILIGSGGEGHNNGFGGHLQVVVAHGGDGKPISRRRDVPAAGCGDGETLLATFGSKVHGSYSSALGAGN